MWQTRFGKCIYVSPSGYRVFQNTWFRWLTFGSPALQTVIFRPCPSKPVLHYLRALSLMVRHNPGSCCLLGLGGAGLPHMLSSIDVPITVVEYSDEVIGIAKQFFMAGSITQLSIVQANAVDFLKHSTAKYAHLLVDLYDDSKFPLECANAYFFNLCYERLLDDGIIAVNLANLKEQRYILQVIKSAFGCTIVIPIKKCSNMVVFASKNRDKNWLLEKIQSTAEIKKSVWVEGWGLVVTL